MLIIDMSMKAGKRPESRDALLVTVRESLASSLAFATQQAIFLALDIVMLDFLLASEIFGVYPAAA